MKKALTITKIIAFLLIIITPFILLFNYVEEIPDQYDKTFFGELQEKYETLKNTEGKKIVFIGGSALPFGLRCDLIEERFPDYEVIDFGLYASLGTKFMMDIAEDFIEEGDIIILSPELSEQTYSLYFNPDSVLMATDGWSEITESLSLSDKISLFYSYFDFAKNKIDYYKNDDAPDPSGIYRKDSFNEYGDIFVTRENNIMVNGFDSTSPIKLTDEMLSEDFTDYLNDYIDTAKAKGASIYFSFSPCNNLSVLSSESTRTAFEEKLKASLNCDLLLDIEDVIIDYRYFYDTNYHLNSSGALYYTDLIVKSLKGALGLELTEADSIDVPSAPALCGEDVVEPVDTEKLQDFDTYNGEPNNDFLDCFEYKLVGSSYVITGVKSEYKNLERVILPSTYNGKNITGLETNCLYGMTNLKEVHIGKTYRSFEHSCFNSCISLEKIYLYETEGNKLSLDSVMFLDGASRNVKIYIPEGSNYTSGYTWINYLDYMVYFERGE